MTFFMLLVVGGIIWWMLANGATFGRQFGTLLERPSRPAHAAWAFLKGRDFAGGEYDGRTVVVALHSKQGTVIVAMQAIGVETTAQPLRERIHGDEARRAWDDLELQHELVLSLDDGWVRAKWRPVSVMFPGRFDADRWRDVLRAMRTLVGSLEQR